MNTRHVYLVLVDTRTWFSRVVKKFTNKQYNHIGLSFDAGKTIYTFGRVNPKNPFSAGFMVENFNEGYYAGKELDCEILSLQVSEISYRQLQRLVQNFAMNKTSYKYNLLGVILVPFGVVLNRKNKYFCSEFVMKMMQLADIIPSIDDLLVPDNARKLNVEQFYAGNIHQLS